jgi:hypothetical protein
MMEKMETFWSPVKGVKIEEIEPGLYSFQFNHHLDMQRILKKGPWYFDNHLLVLDVIPENGNLNQVTLQFVPFWIQVHDIPTGLMSEKVGTEIANFIGEFLEYDAKNNSNYLRSYMRIRVLLDVTKPLKRQKKIKRPGGEASYIKFKYERLSNFCYFCGMLGHIEDYCEKLYAIAEDDGTRLWGPELRVERQNPTGGVSRKMKDSGGANSSAATVTVNTNSNGQSINVQSKPANPAALANLLRNPHLMRPIIANEKTGTEIKDTNKEMLLQEENTEASLTVKPKRSRLFNDDDKTVTTGNQESSIHLSITKLDDTSAENHQTISTADHGNTSTPMDVSKATSFLSAEPGSQACRAQ